MIVRLAQPNDERGLYDLVLYAQRRVLLAEWHQLRASLTEPTRDSTSQTMPQHNLVCGEAEGRVGCFWASTVGAGNIAHLTALIVHDKWPLRETTSAFLSGVKQTLHDSGITQISYLGVESWLIKVLSENGFTHSGSVIALQKADESIPDWGSAEVRVRPAVASDLADILTVDERAFIPLWRTDTPTLNEQLSHSPFFVIAELRQKLVGYAYVSLTGRHGHLTRLVVDPSLQGARIGVRLLAECIGFFQRQGVYGITLNTQKDNARARRLYRWFGFALLGQESEVWLCPL